MTRKPLFCFENYVLDGERRELRHGPDLVAVQPQVFDLLEYLIRNRERVVSKDDLIADIWGGRIVSESALTTRINAARTAVGDSGQQQRLIRTIPRKGFRFVGSLREQPEGTNKEGGLGATAPAPPEYGLRASIGATVERRQLGAPPLASASSEAELPSRSAERRQLTILACEFIGAPALSLQLDAEQFHDVIQAHHIRCRDVVEAHHGRVAAGLADGFIAYFGDPQAQGNEAEDAVRAGLALIALPAPDEMTSGLRARIGIASGTVVMNQLVAGSSMVERIAVGDAPNLAQRLRAAAEPGGIIIAESTRDLIGGLFECRELGRLSLDGYPQPVGAWHVVSASAIDSRFKAQRAEDVSRKAHPAASARQDLTPFVGRSEEMSILTQRCTEAKCGLAVIDICGEPGIGKSRLLHELCTKLIQKNVFVLSGNCWPDGKETAFRPFIDVVRRAFRLVRTDSEENVAHKLERALAILGLQNPENIGLLMNLLGLGTAALAGMDVALIGRRTRELLFQLMQQRGRMAPLALLLEDMHWIDRASQELLARFIDSQTSLPLLIVNTFRPEYAPPWAGRPGVSALRLEPLSPADTTRLVEARLQSRSEAAPLVPLIVEKAEGNPLFAEEMANFLVERVERTMPASPQPGRALNLTPAIPASIQSLLLARADRLTHADRSLLQAASVIGRRFPLDLLSSIAAGEPGLASRLAAMEALDLVRRDPKDGEFVFKHALVRDALYGGLLAPARSNLHLKIAREIERRAAGGLMEVAEVLAHHYAQTGTVEKAIEFLTLAGRKSFGTYSVDEAEGNLRQALALARSTRPETLDDRIIDIMVDLARVLTVKSNSRDIIALVEPLMRAIEGRTDHPRLPILLYFYGFALLTVWRFRDGREIQDKALALAERHGDPKTKAYAIAGVIFLSTAITPLSLDDFRRLADEAFSAAKDGSDVYLFATVAMSVAWNYSNRGMLNEGREWAQRLLGFGRDRRDSRSAGIGLWMSGWLDLLAEDDASALHHGQECMAVGSTPIDRIMGSMVTATAQIRTGAVKEGLALMRHVRDEIAANDWTYLFVATDGPLGLGMMLSGRLGAGLAWLKAFVRRVEAEHPVAGTDFARLLLAQAYVAITCDNRRPSLAFLARNLFPLIRARLAGLVEAERLLRLARRNPMYSPEGIFECRIEFALGRIALARKRADLAREHLRRAQNIASNQNAGILRAKIESVLAAI
jgi:class 3 adenylate cyclase/DNA-binding winged helix-turn-helix (wHTH) protein